MNRTSFVTALVLVSCLSGCDTRSVFGYPDAGGSNAGNDGGNGGNDGARRGPLPVELGSTSNLASVGAYVLLSKAGISNVTGSTISGGHVGVSPATSTAITGFTLVQDGSTTFATSSSVLAPSRVFAADYGSPTPSNLTAAIVAMQNAYVDSSTRTTPDATNLMGGDLGGLTLAPGLYTWNTGVTIPNDVTLSGDGNDVWIFEMTGDLDLSTMTRVVLAGGANARNVFWQVAGQATIHANAHFEGNILCQTAITLQNGASFHGRALAQTMIALNDNDISAP